MRPDSPVVWRVQEPPRWVEERRDYSSCRGYGEMITVLSHVDRPSAQPEVAYEKALEKLRDVRPGDFVLWAGGDPMALLLMGAALNELGVIHDVEWLRWDRRTDPSGNRTPFGYYTPVSLELSTQEET